MSALRATRGSRGRSINLLFQNSELPHKESDSMVPCFQSGAGCAYFASGSEKVKTCCWCITGEDAHLNAALLPGVSCAFWSLFTVLKARTAGACAECSQAVSDGQFKGWGTGRRHRWGLRVRGWLGLSLVIYFFQSRVPLFTKHRNAIPLEQSMHLQLGFGLVHFGFWSLEYLSTSIGVHSLPSLGTAIWSV